MQLTFQYRTVAVLAASSSLATLFYLSLWPDFNAVPEQGEISLQKERLSNHTDYRPAPAPVPSQPSTSLTNQPQIGKLVSENNARVASINSKAFVQFCNTKNNADITNTLSETNENTSPFASYQEWMQYINSNNNDNNNPTALPRFMERPLNNWVVNLTAIQEPCNRHVHTSAHCLDYLTQEHKYLIPSKPSTLKNMDFHIFWRGPFTDKLYLSAHSFLFTQPLSRSKLHLWIDSADLPDGVPEDYTKNEYSASLVSEPLNKYIEIHAWDQAAELAYSYGEEGPKKKTQEQTQQGVKPVALSDEARFLILNRNGGIYLDADVLLLKDMSPFFDSGLEFAYEWSNTNMYNTAVLRLFPGSSVARRILDGAKAREAEIKDRKLREEMEMLEAEAEDVKEEDEIIEDDYDVEGEEEQENDSENEASAVHKSADSKFARQPNIRTKEAKLSKRGEMRPEEIYHPARLRSYLRPQDNAIEGNGLIMMPPALFDPLWLRIDRAEAKHSTDTEKMVEDLHSFPDAFSVPSAVCPAQSELPQEMTVNFSAGPEVFVTGAYAYHWHNSWSTPIQPNSWMGLMRRAYEDFVGGRRPNIYGEWFEGGL
ncbi:hypothetical protein BGX27_010328 [Mortierella sp. AM989]|nr:hypothetical protein BGX27_010328 [Mortierella sp. AM989]